MFSDLLPGKHLLLDNTSVADTYRLRRIVHRPELNPIGSVLRAEKSWEGEGVTPLHAVFDDKLGRFRMWYQIHNPKLEEERKALGNSPHGNVGEPQPIYCCYVESEDGVSWQRPNLGIFPENGGKNNICFKGHSYAAGNTFVYQPKAAPDLRYLMVNCDWKSVSEGGIYIAASPDGIHWNYINEEPLIFGESDTWNCLVYNPEREVFMLYMRAWHSAAIGWEPIDKGNTRRRVSYSESKDLKTWSEPQIILAPDELDTNDFYGLQVFRHADYWLGYLWIYDDDDRDTIEIELIYSQDGVQWSRLPEREKFLQIGTPASPQSHMIVPAQAPLPVGDELWIYYVEHIAPHHVGSAQGETFRAILRADGFLSLKANLQWGAMITRPFVVESDEIIINARAPYGEIRFELVEPFLEATQGDPEGKTIPGFTQNDCDAFRGDDIHHKLSWRGNSDLNTLLGKRVMLRVALQHAEIFSFTI